MSLKGKRKREKEREKEKEKMRAKKDSERDIKRYRSTLSLLMCEHVCGFADVRYHEGRTSSEIERKNGESESGPCEDESELLTC